MNAMVGEKLSIITSKSQTTRHRILGIDDDEPLPLVLSVGPCIFRNSVLAALDAIGRPWRIVLSTPSLSGIRAAVRAGLGVGVRTERWLEPDIRVLDGELPPLPDVELVMISAPDTGEMVVDRLRTALREALTLPAARTVAKVVGSN